MNKNIFCYDDGDDSLTFINANTAGEHTINTGFVLLTLDKKDEIVSIEIMGAHKNFNVSKKVLKSLSRAKVEIRQQEKTMIISISLYTESEKPMVIVNNFPSPGNLHAQKHTFRSHACAL